MSTTLPDAIDVGPVVLDGGLATQLESQGHNLDSALWSARLLHDEPDAIVQAHLAYFAAGAQVATTASYQASFDGFAQAGIRRADAEQLIKRSVRLAEQARASCKDDHQLRRSRSLDCRFDWSVRGGFGRWVGVSRRLRPVS